MTSDVSMSEVEVESAEDDEETIVTEHSENEEEHSDDDMEEDSDDDDDELNDEWTDDDPGPPIKPEDLMVTHDNNFGEEDEALADDYYWNEDAAADAWLARNPGGTRVLYPRLFTVTPDATSGKVETPARTTSRTCPLLRLPLELRSLIYQHYFDHPDYHAIPRNYEYFPDGPGAHLARLVLSSEDVELQFWLSSSIFQICRQIRFEAHPVFFKSHVFTTDYIKVIPRFVDFIGKEGCAWIRYLDLFDHDAMKRAAFNADEGYTKIIASLLHFPRLRHLRIVLGNFSNDKFFFNPFDFMKGGRMKPGAKPTMIRSNLETHWPEYSILKNINAADFTLALDAGDDDYIREFFNTSGPLADLITSMRANYTLRETDDKFSASAVAHQAVNGTAIAALPGSTPAIEAAQIQWQDTDYLADKTVPLYNFIREVVPETTDEGFEYIHACFPRAARSTGAIMRDCPMCCVEGAHCGYHAIPDTHSNEAHDLQFQKLSYVEMMKFAKIAIESIYTAPRDIVDHFERILTLQRHNGWPEQASVKLLDSLDQAVATGWEGKYMDKQEVRIWDVVYRMVYAKVLDRQDSNLLDFCGSCKVFHGL